MTDKLRPHQLQKNAYIYLRQSSMRQVYHNQESTERQYALKDKAVQLGWPPEQIIVLDQDLGQSGAQSHQREDFKKLVAEVCLEKAGAVFALEASRLSRSCADWHRLLNLCAFTNTLIIDDDGIYDPSDYNDQLILGLKGTMSQAELHVMKGRLLKAKLNKAQKGELRFPLPVGFCHDDCGHIILDIDEEVRGTVRLLFSTFRKIGTAHGVAREFTKNHLKFPKRAYGGIWKGKLIWGNLTTSRTLQVLKNPSYAGVYVFGRYKYAKQLSPQGDIHTKMKKLPINEWPVHIQNHHEGYITWEEFQKNQSMLHGNRTNEEPLSSALREGKAILQGLLICSSCGYKISPRYKGNNGLYPMYECNKARRDGIHASYCMSFRADKIDEAIICRVFEIIKKDQIKIAVNALNEIEKRDEEIQKQWSMKVQRAEYEAEIAQKRYEQVDPSNRLVASTLEKAWNDALSNIENIKLEIKEIYKKPSILITEEQKKELLALAQDFPTLWNASSTKSQDRKRILHLLIKDITVEKNKNLVTLHIRWQGGTMEDIKVELPLPQPERVKYPSSFIDEIRQLSEILSDEQIVHKLNSEGRLSARGKPFTRDAIEWVRFKYRISSPKLFQKRSDEFTVAEMAQKFNVSCHVIYYWIEHNFVTKRKLHPGWPWWISCTPEKEQDLKKRIAESKKLCYKLPKTS